MQLLTLYTTSGCHLCAEAEALLDKLQNMGHCQWLSVDVSDDDRLISQYGLRIPVLVNTKNEELGWPFALPQITEWLSKSPDE